MSDKLILEAWSYRFVHCYLKCVLETPCIDLHATVVRPKLHDWNCFRQWMGPNIIDEQRTTEMRTEKKASLIDAFTVADHDCFWINIIYFSYFWNIDMFSFSCPDIAVNLLHTVLRVNSNNIINVTIFEKCVFATDSWKLIQTIVTFINFGWCLRVMNDHCIIVFVSVLAFQ